MQIAELGTLTQVQAFSNDDPFVYTILPGLHTTATYWTTTFGAPDESNTEKVFISGFVRGAFNPYSEAASIAACRTTEKTFFWDNDNQTLYVHIEHDQAPDSDVYYYETFLGFTDESVIYIDDQEYSPLIQSTPKISQKQDIINYNKLSFGGGSLVLNNNGGELDYLIGSKLYGNNAFNSFLDPDDITETAPGVFSASRSDVQRLQAFYIDDYEIGISKATFRLLDPRKAFDVSIPTEKFTVADYPDIADDYIGKIIPLRYGPTRELTAIPVDGKANTHVTFSAGLIMTDFGTVQVKIDEVWTTKIPIGETLSNGEFVLNTTDARDSSGSVRECKLVDAIGIANSGAGDVLKDLNERFLNKGFTSTFYNTTEWTAETASLTAVIGISFESSILLYEAIRLIQNGSEIGFRYEINAENKITIRIDDEDREILTTLHNVQFDRYNISVDTDSSLVFSEVTINYSKSYNSGVSLSVTNDDFKEEVAGYRQQRSLLVETFLTTESDAETRALFDATRFSRVPEIVTLLIDTPTKADRTTFLNLRIFDILKAELTPSEFVDLDNETIEGRVFYGIQAIKVLSIAPVPDKMQNRITAKLLPDYIERLHFDFTRTSGQDHFDFTRTIGQKHFDFTRDE